METTQNNTNGYQKKSIWKWVAIYGIIGLVVYGLIYYLFLAPKNGSGYGQSKNGQQTQESQLNTIPSPGLTNITPTMTQSESTVTLSTNGYEPATLSIKLGTQVTWVNKSGQDATVNSDPHPIHTAYPPLNLGNFSDGGTLTLLFDKAGTYGYHNHLNPGEKGTIIVE
jgi:plastocyanin